MDLTKYLNQTAVLKRKTGVDKWGNTTYGAPTTIKVRKSRSHKATRQKTEYRFTDETDYMSRELILIGDMVDEQEINFVEDLVQKNGVALGCKFSPAPPNTLGGNG